jgi:hypothetical protein
LVGIGTGREAGRDALMNWLFGVLLVVSQVGSTAKACDRFQESVYWAIR